MRDSITGPWLSLNRIYYLSQFIGYGTNKIFRQPFSPLDLLAKNILFPTLAEQVYMHLPEKRFSITLAKECDCGYYKQKYHTELKDTALNFIKKRYRKCYTHHCHWTFFITLFRSRFFIRNISKHFLFL